VPKQACRHASMGINNVQRHISRAHWTWDLMGYGGRVAVVGVGIWWAMGTLAGCTALPAGGSGGLLAGAQAALPDMGCTAEWRAAQRHNWHMSVSVALRGLHIAGFKSSNQSCASLLQAAHFILVVALAQNSAAAGT